MKFSKKIVVVAAFLAAAAGRAALAYSNIGARGGTSRRQLFQKAASASAAAAAAAFLPQAEEAQAAVEACLPQSQNCIRTTWTPPVGTSKADVAQALQDALTSYPQQGQQGADNAGWTVVQDDLLKGGKARIEYKNFGNFAKFLNGGKPFVDDLTVEISEDGKAVEVRSASRIGESDLGVNRKRLLFLGSALESKGWTVPDPKY